MLQGGSEVFVIQEGSEFFSFDVLFVYEYNSEGDTITSSSYILF